MACGGGGEAWDGRRIGCRGSGSGRGRIRGGRGRSGGRRGGASDCARDGDRLGGDAVNSGELAQDGGQGAAGILEEKRVGRSAGRGARSAERGGLGRMPAGCRRYFWRYGPAGRGRAVFGGSEPGDEGIKIDRLVPDVGQDGAGAGESAELGGRKEALGGVAESVKDGLEAQGAVIEAGAEIGCEGVGTGLVMRGEDTHGGAGGGEDGDDEVIERGAVGGRGSGGG